jgi:hypothetical protein
MTLVKTDEGIEDVELTLKGEVYRLQLHVERLEGQHRDYERRLYNLCWCVLITQIAVICLLFVGTVLQSADQAYKVIFGNIAGGNTTLEQRVEIVKVP